MSTQYGNFLYQVDAKQFPGQRGQPRSNQQQSELNALKNQLHTLQAYQSAQAGGASLNI